MFLSPGSNSGVVMTADASEFEMTYSISWCLSSEFTGPAQAPSLKQAKYDTKYSALFASSKLTRSPFLIPREASSSARFSTSATNSLYVKRNVPDCAMRNSFAGLQRPRDLSKPSMLLNESCGMTCILAERIVSVKEGVLSLTMGSESAFLSQN